MSCVISTLQNPQGEVAFNQPTIGTPDCCAFYRQRQRDLAADKCGPLALSYETPQRALRVSAGYHIIRCESGGSKVVVLQPAGTRDGSFGIKSS